MKKLGEPGFPQEIKKEEQLQQIVERLRAKVETLRSFVYFLTREISLKQNPKEVASVLREKIEEIKRQYPEDSLAETLEKAIPSLVSRFKSMKSLAEKYPSSLPPPEKIRKLGGVYFSVPNKTYNLIFEEREGKLGWSRNVVGIAISPFGVHIFLERMPEQTSASGEKEEIIILGQHLRRTPIQLIKIIERPENPPLVYKVCKTEVDLLEMGNLCNSPPGTLVHESFHNLVELTMTPPAQAIMIRDLVNQATQNLVLMVIAKTRESFEIEKPSMDRAEITIDSQTAHNILIKPFLDINQYVEAYKDEIWARLAAIAEIKPNHTWFSYDRILHDIRLAIKAQVRVIENMIIKAMSYENINLIDIPNPHPPPKNLSIKLFVTDKEKRKVLSEFLKEKLKEVVFSPLKQRLISLSEYVIASLFVENLTDKKHLYTTLFLTILLKPQQWKHLLTYWHFIEPKVLELYPLYKSQRLPSRAEIKKIIENLKNNRFSSEAKNFLSTVVEDFLTVPLDDPSFSDPFDPETMREYLRLFKELCELLKISSEVAQEYGYYSYFQSLLYYVIQDIDRSHQLIKMYSKLTPEEQEQLREVINSYIEAGYLLEDIAEVAKKQGWTEKEKERVKREIEKVLEVFSL